MIGIQLFRSWGDADSGDSATIWHKKRSRARRLWYVLLAQSKPFLAMIRRTKSVSFFSSAGVFLDLQLTLRKHTFPPAK